MIKKKTFRVGNSIELPTLLLFLLFSPFAPLISSPLSRSYLPSPSSPYPTFRLLESGYGPEDIVVDSLHNPPRLLISCASRRAEYPVYGEIESIQPNSNTRLVMKRIGDPEGLAFRPHGISLIQAGEIQYLYVITHDDKNERHPIIQYQIEDDELIFIRMLESKLLVSPNALQAFPDGSLVVCNDAAVRNSMKEKIYMQKKGNVLFYDGQGNWTIAALSLGMPAGLTGIGNQIFVSATLENKLYSYNLRDGQLLDKKLVCRIKGPDNIRISHDKLIITSHSKPIKFIFHTKKKSRHSPSLVVLVDPASGKQIRLFYDNGKQINAASVAVMFNNQLVIGQIFEPFIGIYDKNR